ncbi:undecaprenyl-diphosphatase [Winogradskyella epiphytica]|uniref:Undecaprenyl-diphosphatase n=1 Tax=Winogradskyella epiphytica TaxID=262005 RepID=A0A2V4XBN6_9FLAO|nr:phosphatase PAP2 family protein [Winogradskyella epiphytica]PYE79596.1 undecaprenyl-diphosphatase [Winogradskyella epiphytica]GGW74073.1 phosphatase PAP2 family protein [Winogradskyella epiphytica]
MLDQLLEYDKELFLYLNNWGSETWDKLWLIITYKFSSIPIYATLLYLIYKKFGWKALLMMVFVIAAMITFTDQITNIFKDTFQRPRPCRAEGIMDLTRFVAPRCGKYGFFSGHASNSMSTAVFAGLLLRPYFKNLIYLMLIWSIVVAYSRIYVGVHYPLDIVCGLTFGAVTGYGFYKLNKYLLNKFISE